MRTTTLSKGQELVLVQEVGPVKTKIVVTIEDIDRNSVTVSAVSTVNLIEYTEQLDLVVL